VILTLFLIDFYGSVAKLVGLAANTSIQEQGRVPRMREALIVDSVGTTVAAVAGTSNITVYVESAVGIGAGGRTGLTAVTCGVLMLACLGLAPFLHWVPLVATTGALVYVAVKLCPPIAELRRFGLVDILAVGAMQVVVVLTFALDRAVLVGLLFYLGSQLLRREKVNVFAVISVLLLAMSWALQ
jgi:AGZA family xanthine/uracil permease-like MFS transporter